MEIVRYDSAGGIVFDGDRLLLLRKSALGEVVLPKGHVEPGETAEGAALRETVEETGYTKLEVLADLGAANTTL
jgi:8-oxo-dGTP pyrophosphatase MutT (NUDIX family)